MLTEALPQENSQSAREVVLTLTFDWSDDRKYGRKLRTTVNGMTYIVDKGSERYVIPGVRARFTPVVVVYRRGIAFVRFLGLRKATPEEVREAQA